MITSNTDMDLAKRIRQMVGSFLVTDKETGELADSIKIMGDQRSEITFDKDTSSFILHSAIFASPITRDANAIKILFINILN